MTMPHPLLLLATAGALGAVELAPLFHDHAVLQRDRPVAVWGRGQPGELVEVRFADQRKNVTTDARGAWMVRLDAMPAAKEGRPLVVQGTSTITVADVVVGEVWICSGQSNMEFRLSGALNAKEEVAAADQRLIRHIKVPLVQAGTPSFTFEAAWETASPKTAATFTAVGYFFARDLVAALGVPVGLINASWSGSRIEPWISPAGFRQVPELAAISEQIAPWDPCSEPGSKIQAAYLAQLKSWLALAETAVAARQPAPPMPVPPDPSDAYRTTRYWNGMIHPLVPYGIRGVLWYQGESNGGEGLPYLHKLQALTGGWRQAFGQGDIPFYAVQIANYQESDPAKPWGGNGVNWGRTREAQLQAVKSIANFGLAVAIDIGEGPNIHPRNKQDVGHRLALWALARDYGRPVVYSGPLFATQVVEGTAIRVRFDHLGGGLMVGSKTGLAPAAPVKDGKLTWWAIAGEDKDWHVAEARIDGDSVLVGSPAVAKPVAVRYAFTMNPAGANLYNREGLPASPFRTDTW
jgi:sialate O-acetylesterase